jgi:hypothetical protein
MYIFIIGISLLLVNMIKVEKDVADFVHGEAKSQGIKRPVVLIMDCGCILNQETIELDIKDENDTTGYDFYTLVDGLKFYINPKLKHLADTGKIFVFSYGEGKFKRLDYSPR